MPSWERIILKAAKDSYKKSKMTEYELEEERESNLNEAMACFLELLMCLGCICAILYFIKK